MGDKKKSRKSREPNKCGPSFSSDQIGENAGEGRLMKAMDDKSKK